MDIRLSLTQNQILSQKMIQSMEILQMSCQELNEYIKEVSLENPVVDIEEGYEMPDKASDLVRKLEWLDSLDERNRIYSRQRPRHVVCLVASGLQDELPFLPDWQTGI